MLRVSAAIVFGLLLPHTALPAQSTPMGSGQQPGQAPDQPNAPVPPIVRKTGHASSTTNLTGTGAKLEHAIADPADLPPLVPAGRPAIGVALEGGGALGLAHIGVLRWMEEHRIPVDRIAGNQHGRAGRQLFTPPV